MEDMDLYAGLGLSNSADGFAKQRAQPPEVQIPASAARALELDSNKAQHGPEQPPALDPTAIKATQPTSFLPGSISSIVAPQQPGQAPSLSGAQAAVLAYQDAEVKELKGMVKKLQQEATESLEKLHKQEEQLRTLESERSILVRNISTIYRTAVMELDRKNTEIKGLRTQLEQQQQQQQQQTRSLSAERTMLLPTPPIPPQLPLPPTNVAAAPSMPQPPLIPCIPESHQQGYNQSTSREPDLFQDGERRPCSSERGVRGRQGSREPEVARRGSEERMASKHDGRSRSGDLHVSESKQRGRGRDPRERRDEDYERRRDGSRHGKDAHDRREAPGLSREREGGRGRRKEESKDGEERNRAPGRDRDRERGDRDGRRGEREGASLKRHSMEDALRKRGRT